MRNLKRVLSLALALVMMLGMMIIGASAASADFPDAAEIDYTEAVDVISGLGIMTGDDKGNFNPDSILTREQAAKIICYTLIGAENADKLGNNTQIFTDVAAGRWSAGYIAYCANLGILVGDGNGKFRPEDYLTGVQFGKMLLTAAGYDAEMEGYVNNADWATNIATDMIDNDLDIKGVIMADNLKREQAAQMLLQAMDMDTVRYGNGNVIGMVGPFETGDTFAEKYFPKLEKIEGVVTANEYADLNSGKALAAGKTVIGGKTYKGTTALTDIGESRVGWANDGKILYLADSGKNTVFETGAATSFLDKKGEFDSSVFSKTTGMKYGKDTEEYKQFDDAIVDTYEADIRIVYSTDGTYDHAKTIRVDTTFKKASQTYEDLYNIFNDDDYETGWVLVGTTASTDNDKNFANDVSNGMSFKKFVNEYLTSDEENTVTVNKTGNGDWLKIVDNDNDGTADYVFLTEFTMEEVVSLSKKGVLTLTSEDDSKIEFGGTGKNDIPYATSEEDLTKGDVVLYTVIDGTAYVELAPSFTGEVDKYTYKTGVLTVDGEDYEQSDIAEHTGYLNELEAAEKETEYTYYQDFFGYIRIFSEPIDAAGDLVLLTDAYYQTGKNSNDAAVKAYLNDKLSTYDVNTRKMGGFIDAHGDNNNWGKLKEYWNDNDAMTNVARYTESDGVLSLATAKTYTFDKKGNENGIKTDYVDLDEQTFKAGETDFKGTYTRDDDDADYEADVNSVIVQANKNTVFYYVSRDDKTRAAVVDEVIVGYKNTIAVTTNDTIKAMYAVATNVSSDAYKTNYWVADVIVIETEDPVVAISKDVTLVYNVENKTYKDYAGVKALNNNADDVSLNVVSLNGNDYDKFVQSDIVNPWFYTNSVDKNGDSYLRRITKDYDEYGIYAVTVDRQNMLYEYFKTLGDKKTIEFNADTLPVYDIVEKTKANSLDDDGGDLKVKVVESYIIYTVKDKAVYAIHVDTDKASATKDLFDAIVEDALPQDTKDLRAAKAAAVEALKNYAAATVDSAYINSIYADLTVEDIQDTLDEQIDRINACTDTDAVDAIIDASLAVEEHTGEETGVAALDAAAINAASAAATIAVVEDETELAAAVDDSNIKTIKLGADIELTTALKLGAGVTLDGQGHTIFAEGPYNVGGSGSHAAILVEHVADVTIKDLTVVGPNARTNQWDEGEYGIQIFGDDAGATLENVTVNGANTGIGVFSCTVTLKGEIDVSGNEFGGILVDQGSTCSNPGKLVIAKGATLVNAAEAAGAPTIWCETALKGSVTKGDQTLYRYDFKKDETTTQITYYLAKSNVPTV